MDINKQISDLRKNGLEGVWTKIKNRLTSPIVKDKAKKISSRARNNGQKSILIINGAQKSVSEIHRVVHFEDKLKLLNILYLRITNNMLNRFTINSLTGFDLLYIHRNSAEGETINLIKKYHQLGKKVIYDIDDLIFDPDKLDNIAFLKEKNNHFRQFFKENTLRHLKIMKMVDLVTTPTDFLTEYVINKFHINSSVLRNHLDQNSLQKGKNIFDEKDKKFPDQITIGYFPGTKTHQSDFGTIEKILAELLAKYPNLRLKIVGELSLNKLFEKYKKQIIKQNKVPYSKMMSIYNNVDINLAPLEMNNDFCEGKSELKYFFAGACGIPTIASATDAFKHAINHHKNGYLCYEAKDWRKYITLLIQNKQKRLELGKAAFEQVNLEYTPDYQASELKHILEKLF